MDSSEGIQRGGMTFNKSAVLKGTWLLCMFFSAIFIIVAIITADDNEKSEGGFRVIGFTGIWLAFIMTAIMSLSAQVVFDEWRSPFVIGALIGASIMLSQLLFVMMIVYFVFADHAENNDHSVNDSDRALGAFSLFTMLAYLLLAGVLLWLQADIMEPLEAAEEEEQMIGKDGSSHSSNDPKETVKNDNPPSKYSIDSQDDDADVVDIDLEETETF